MFAQMPEAPEEVRAVPLPVARLKAGGAGVGVGVGSGHVYAAGNRDSGGPLDIGEALARAMRSRASVDSGLGMSVSGDHGERVEKVAEHQPSMSSLRPPREAVQHPYNQHRPHILDFSTQQNTSRSQNHPALPASGEEHLTPPPFARSAAARAVLGTPSDPSPGIVSHESSPPVSPRPFSSTDDLERFRDLFWKPNGRAPSASSAAAATAGGSRPARQSQSRAGVPFDVSSRSTLSQSGGGLTQLTRQLSEELEVMQEHDEALVDPASHPMYGGRFGGLRGERPLEGYSDPNVILGGVRSESPEPVVAALPLRLHRGQGRLSDDLPAIVPEDVESSRASSILERSPLEDTDYDRECSHAQVVRRTRVLMMFSVQVSCGWARSKRSRRRSPRRPTSGSPAISRS